VALSRYIQRSIEPKLKQAVAEFPAVILTGPRQCGKTTLLKHLFGDQVHYVSVEPPDVRAFAVADPRGFLASHPAPVIFDEIQHAPELLPYIKEKIDQNRSQHGQYILTGSQNLLMLEGISETLAGRVAILKLLPLSRREIMSDPGMPQLWDDKALALESAAGPIAPHVGDWWRMFLRGGYPELWEQPGRDAELWHSSYIQTYLERDVRGLKQIGDLTQFQSFLGVLAARGGQLLNLSDVSRDLGIAVNTLKQWLSVLEATFQVIVLRPYYVNIGKRLVKTPKVYFTDTGTLCHLVGLKDPQHAAAGPMGGVIFETAVLSEIVKTIRAHGIEPRIFFWRTSTGEEIDFIIENYGGSDLTPVEVKLSSTPSPVMTRQIRKFQDAVRTRKLDSGSAGGSALRAKTGFVVHLGQDCNEPIHIPDPAPDVITMPFGRL
jgi:hypothetical protein